MRIINKAMVENKKLKKKVRSRVEKIIKIARFFDEGSDAEREAARRVNLY